MGIMTFGDDGEDDRGPQKIVLGKKRKEQTGLVQYRLPDFLGDRANH